MQERDRRPGEGDIRGPTTGDFSDWDSPEDEMEEAPEDYYDEGQDQDEEYEPSPDDPDYDLSEAAGYSPWEAPPRRSLLPQWLIVAISLLLILSLLLPALRWFGW